MRYTPNWWQGSLDGHEVLVSDEFTEQEAQTLFNHFAFEMIEMDSSNPVKISGVPRSFSPHVADVAILRLFSSSGRVQMQIKPHTGRANYLI